MPLRFFLKPFLRLLVTEDTKHSERLFITPYHFDTSLANFKRTRWDALRSVSKYEATPGKVYKNSLSLGVAAEGNFANCTKRDDINGKMVRTGADGDGWRRLVLGRGSHSTPLMRKRQTTLASRTAGPRPRIGRWPECSRRIDGADVLCLQRCYFVSGAVMLD